MCSVEPDFKFVNASSSQKPDVDNISLHEKDLPELGDSSFPTMIGKAICEE